VSTRHLCHRCNDLFMTCPAWFHVSGRHVSSSLAACRLDTWNQCRHVEKPGVSCRPGRHLGHEPREITCHIFYTACVVSRPPPGRRGCRDTSLHLGHLGNSNSMPTRGHLNCFACGMKPQSKSTARHGIRKAEAIKRFNSLGLRVSQSGLVFVGGKWREYSDTFLLRNTTCNSQDAAVSALNAKRVQPPSHLLHRKICASARLCLSAPLFVGQTSRLLLMQLQVSRTCTGKENCCSHKAANAGCREPRRLRRHLGTG
jgi:hypothetical protein